MRNYINFVRQIICLNFVISHASFLLHSSSCKIWYVLFSIVYIVYNKYTLKSLIRVYTHKLTSVTVPKMNAGL